MKFALPALAVVAVASALPQTTSTPPPSFKITNVVSGGTGCPQGSIDVDWTDDRVLPICKSASQPPNTLICHRSNIRIVLHLHNSPTNISISQLTSPDYGKEFIAAVGPKAETTDSRKFCQLNLELSYSAGFSFAVYSAEYAGFADLEAGVTGTVKSNYYFSGKTEQVRHSPGYLQTIVDDCSILTIRRHPQHSRSLGRRS